MNKRPAKLKIKKVQDNFNAAIRRRDGRCVISGDTRNLDCSHFYNVGGSSSLRFYPYNAFAMTKGIHIAHHNRDPLMYAKWMQAHHPEELDWMERVRGRTIRYNQGLLREIDGLCKADKLDELAEIIRELLGGQDGI